MTDDGFNLKVQKVENGYTICVTKVYSTGGEVQRDFVALDEVALKETIDGEVNRWLGKSSAKPPHPAAEGNC